MIRTHLLRTLALGALVVMFGAGQAQAAFLALVPTASSGTSHSYDVILDTEGSGVGGFDAFFDVVEVGCPGCIVGVIATDSTQAATGMFSSFTSGGNSFHYGGFSLTGQDVGPFAGVIIGTVQVDHTDTAAGPSGGLIEVRLGPSPPSGFTSAAVGPLPNTSCPDPSGCALATIEFPEPASMLLLGVGLAGLAFVQRRRD